MHRRVFAQTIGRTAMTASLAPAVTAQTLAGQTQKRPNPWMHVGGDYHSVAGGRQAGITNRKNLEYNLRYGVKHLTAAMANQPSGGGWSLDQLKRMREDCDRVGMTLEVIRMDSRYITLREKAERDREIEIIIGNIEKASQIGVKIITYHWTVIPIRRNKKTLGRGGVTYSGFELEKNWRDLPLGPSGRVLSQDYWERIEYFLKNVIPAAREHDVRLACHPYDPPGLPFGYQGADNWDSPDIFAAIKRYESIENSPYNGFQLCLGTTAEGLRNPKTEILPVVRYLGERGKIHQIHMRNIRGGLHQFDEVFPDEGVLDFFAIMRILRDVQFRGSICPDHMPQHPDDPESLQSFAFGYGYIKALIQAVNAEVGAA